MTQRVDRRCRQEFEVAVLIRRSVLGLLLVMSSACGSHARSAGAAQPRPSHATPTPTIDEWFLSQSQRLTVAGDHSLIGVVMDYHSAGTELSIAMSVDGHADGITTQAEAIAICDALLADALQRRVPVSTIRIYDLSEALVVTNGDREDCYPVP